MHTVDHQIEFDSRYERKFLAPKSHYFHAINAVRIHPSHFSNHFQTRRINNIYFDTFDFRNFDENQIGLANRQKYRIRWYGSSLTYLENPVLEIKLRDGHICKKAAFRMQNLRLEPGFGSMEIQQHLQKQELPREVLSEVARQEPTLLNHYDRRYWLSWDQRFRVTLDSSLCYHRLQSMNNYLRATYEDYSNTVLELKYDLSGDDDAQQVINNFPFRVSKMSKYSFGIEITRQLFTDIQTNI